MTVSRIADRFAAIDRKRAEQTVFAGGKSQTTADTSNTTDTANYSDAIVWAWDELPDGVYVVVVRLSLLMSSSTADQVSLRTHCNGEDGTGHTRSVTADLVNRLVAVRTYTEVEADGGTGITIKGQFKVGGAGTGTAAASNPEVTATAIRVGA